MNWMTSIISIPDQQVSALRHGAWMKGKVSLAVFIVDLYLHMSITPHPHARPYSISLFASTLMWKQLLKCSACSRRIHKKLSERCIRFILGNRRMRRHTVAVSHCIGCRICILATLYLQLKTYAKRHFKTCLFVPFWHREAQVIMFLHHLKELRDWSHCNVYGEKQIN